ncbi:hypothetical protein [Planctomicrobium piriforme]|uniref:Uncharacterized protein n=1 Tax=Planctomicrobium piriforme TaxID=1576369 RepID=A0A1I3M4E9_9PLAN|nr:hypothetical protein [Planctomicrobium piriforme]SFI91797.1 hypothetical protein SAMN05421753_113153 [Planctomicrobium piriforme]
MARCDQGYLCEVCGREVPNITQSDLYLRFVIGEIDGRQLLAAPERHLRCNPTLSQFIVADKFEPVTVEGPFAKEFLDSEDVCRREEVVTRGWRRLQELQTLRIPIHQYPLPEFQRERPGEPK